MLRDSGKRQSRYHIFVLSLWEEGGDYPGANSKWRFSLENAHRAERKGFKDLEQLMAHLGAWTQNVPADTNGDLPTTAEGENAMPMSINRSITTPIVHAPGTGETVSIAGVTLTYKTVGSQSDGQFLVLEFTAPPQYASPPHWHKVTTDIIYVLEGTLTLLVDDESIQVGPGGYLYVPPRTVYNLANQSDAPAKYLVVASPAGLENYVAELSELLKHEPSWPPQDMSKMNALMVKYDTFEPPVS